MICKLAIFLGLALAGCAATPEGDCSKAQREFFAADFTRLSDERIEQLRAAVEQHCT